MFLLLAVASKTKSEAKMKGIMFKPDMFDSLDFSQYSVPDENECTKQINFENIEPNNITIAAPEEIIFDSSVPGFEPAIPVCARITVYTKWADKYHDFDKGMSYEGMFYIRREGESDWHSGQIDQVYRLYNKFGVSKTPDQRWVDDSKRAVEQRFEEVQNLTDDDLNTGAYSGHTITENLLDYVNIPLSSGVYEIYMSRYNLESNKVKIIFKDKKAE